MKKISLEMVPRHDTMATPRLRNMVNVLRLDDAFGSIFQQLGEVVLKERESGDAEGIHH
jgi:hypothetical protein